MHVHPPVIDRASRSGFGDRPGHWPRPAQEFKDTPRQVDIGL
jgi:hypothetical protein